MDLFFVPGVDSLALTLRPMWRTFESAVGNFPSPAVFGQRPLVITKDRNYSAHDMEDFLAATGYGAAVEPFRRRVVPKMGYFQAPMVPTTCLNGVGIETPEQLVYWDGDFDKDPEMVNGDGDDEINLVSMLAFDERMRQQSQQNKLFKSIRLEGATHSTIVTDSIQVAVFFSTHSSGCSWTCWWCLLWIFQSNQVVWDG